MKQQGVARCRKAFESLVGLLIPLLVLCACRGTFESLSRKEARIADQSQDSEPVLVRIAACSGALPLADDLTGAYGAEDAHLLFDLVPASSRTAAELLLAAQADLAIVGGAANVNIVSKESTDGRGIRSQVLATDAIAIIVHKDWPLDGLSTSELAALFAGYHLDWKELEAGSGRPEMVCREQGSASQIVFEQIVMGESPVSSSAILMPHDRGVVEYVALHPGAIGYTSAAYVDDRVKLVSLDGALPTANKVERGKYPLTYPLVLLTSPRAPREASRLVEFAKSSQGRRIIRQRYVVPR